MSDKVDIDMPDIGIETSPLCSSAFVLAARLEFPKRRAGCRGRIRCDTFCTWCRPLASMEDGCNLCSEGSACLCSSATPRDRMRCAAGHRRRGKGQSDKQDIRIVASPPRSLAAAWHAKLQCRKSRGRPGDTIPSDISCKCCSQLWSKVDGCNQCIVCFGLCSTDSTP